MDLDAKVLTFNTQKSQEKLSQRFPKFKNKWLPKTNKKFSKNISDKITNLFIIRDIAKDKLLISTAILKEEKLYATKRGTDAIIFGAPTIVREIFVGDKGARMD